MTQPAETTPNPVLDVLAKIHVTLGGIDQKLAEQQRHHAWLNTQIYPLYIDLIDVTTSGTTDRPNIMGPRTGWYWDIHTIIGQGITAGSVAIYKNSASGQQWGNITTSGQLNWGKAQFLLTAGDRILFVGSASLPATGAAMSIVGTQIHAPLLGRYLE